MTQDMQTRHDRRRDRTRSLLQEALLDLVLERGFEEIVVQEITDRADVGRGTFYFHFDSKEDLLWSVVEDRFPFKDSPAEGLLDGGIPDQPEYYHLVSRSRQFEKNKTVFLAVFGPHGSPLAASRVRELLAEETLQEIWTNHLYGGVGQPDQVTAQIVVGLTLSLVVWWLENDIPYTPMQIGGILYRTLLHREPPGGTWQGVGSR